MTFSKCQKEGLYMKYCSKCGKEIMDEAVICPACGCPQKEMTAASSQDASSFGWGLLGFCIPVAGLILYLVWKDGTPLKAMSAGKGALIGFIAAIVLYIIYAIIAAIFEASLYCY